MDNMPPIPPDPLIQAIARVMADINLLTDKDSLTIEPQKLDGLARSISTHLKALDDLNSYNRKAAKEAEDQKYLSYEDLPPPSPEDRKRFYIRLKSLIRDVEDDAIQAPYIDDALGPEL